MMVSVICPIFNEKKYITGFIDSVLRQDFPKNDLEVLFIDGMSTDRTRETVAVYQQKYPFIRLIDNPHRTVPYAMNIGIRESSGEIIIRLDAHAIYPDNYFSALVGHLDEFGADNVGGVCETLPVNDTPKAIAIARVLSSRFGMGNSYFRTGTRNVREVDTVPFGCFRKSLFDRIGLYDEELIRNQDDELNARIINNGGRIFLIPDIVVKYYARDTISKIWKMFYQYGLYKPLVNKKLGKPASVRQFFPVVFVLGIALGWSVCIIWPIMFYVYGAVLILYLLMGVTVGFMSSLKVKKSPLIFWMPGVFGVVHLSYGIGYLYGIFKILMGRNFNAKVNR